MNVYEHSRDLTTLLAVEDKCDENNAGNGNHLYRGFIRGVKVGRGNGGQKTYRGACFSIDLFAN